MKKPRKSAKNVYPSAQSVQSEQTLNVTPVNFIEKRTGPSSKVVDATLKQKYSVQTASVQAGAGKKYKSYAKKKDKPRRERRFVVATGANISNKNQF